MITSAISPGARRQDTWTGSASKPGSSGKSSSMTTARSGALGQLPRFSLREPAPARCCESRSWPAVPTCTSSNNTVSRDLAQLRHCPVLCALRRLRRCLPVHTACLPNLSRGSRPRASGRHARNSWDAGRSHDCALTHSGILTRTMRLGPNSTSFGAVTQLTWKSSGYAGWLHSSAPCCRQSAQQHLEGISTLSGTRRPATRQKGKRNPADSRAGAQSIGPSALDR